MTAAFRPFVDPIKPGQGPQNLLDTLKTGAATLVDKVKDVRPLEYLQGLQQTPLYQGAAQVVDTLKTGASSLVDKVNNVHPLEYLQNIQDTGIYQGAAKAVDILKNGAGTLVEKVTNIPSYLSGIGTFFKDLYQKYAVPIIGGIGGALSSLAAPIVNAYTTAVGAITSAVPFLGFLSSIPPLVGIMGTAALIGLGVYGISRVIRGNPEPTTVLEVPPQIYQ